MTEEAPKAFSSKKAGASLTAFFVEMKTPLKFVLWASVVVATALVLFFAYLIWAFMTPYSASSFNQDKWMALSEISRQGECGRGTMGEDIVDNVLKIGMARQEVENLLGPPDGPYYPETYPNEYIYNLGMCSGFAIDYDLLHVTYDQENRLIRAANMQH